MTGSDSLSGMGHKLGYARISTADQDPQLQLDALQGEGCLKIYTDVATGTTSDRPRMEQLPR